MRLLRRTYREKFLGLYVGGEYVGYAKKTAIYVACFWEIVGFGVNL